MNSTERPVILFANVMKDSYPVLNADVKAVVTGPCQSITQVPLYDGGIGRTNIY